MDGKLLVVPAGSIDSDINIKPQGHIYYASKAILDGAGNYFLYF